jgi:hypothetical protein
LYGFIIAYLPQRIDLNQRPLGSKAEVAALWGHVGAACKSRQLQYAVYDGEVPSVFT